MISKQIPAGNSCEYKCIFEIHFTSDVDDIDPTIRTKKAGDETSDEEKEWLTALEKGELDDYGEVSKGEKDPSLMTARQVMHI